MTSLVEAADAVRRGERSPRTLVDEALEAAERARDLNLFAHLDADRARAEADARTDEIRAGHTRGALHGVPVTVKDLFAVAGVPMAAGTRAALPALPGLDDPAGDACAVARLRAAGAVVLGTTNMVEVALGIHGENPWTGDVGNPRDPARQAGGSSSGSAAAVAAGAGLASLGTDTAGSVRIPAALCGVVGAKPTHGRVPLDGALPLAPTCDHGGVLAHTVADASLVLDVLTGVRPAPLVPSRPRRLAVPVAHLDGALAPDVRALWSALLDRVRDAGVELVEVTPPLDDVLDAYTTLTRAEAAHVHHHALETAPDGFSPGVRGPLSAGLEVRAVDYLAARAVRRRVLADLVHVLAGVDAMLVPTNPVPAPVRGTVEVTLESGPLPHREAFLRLTAPYSFAGVPAVTVPYDTVPYDTVPGDDAAGLPLGVSVVTQPDADRPGLEVAAWVEALVAPAP